MVASVLVRNVAPDPDTDAVDAELEAEVQAVAASFEALPAEWQRYLDQEARAGRRAYGEA
jgi:hypothetical protein